MKPIQLLCLTIFIYAVSCNTIEKDIVTNIEPKPNQYITILGIAQDAGYPQINCDKKCCKSFYHGEEDKKLVSCLGLVDLESQSKWLFDATPDIAEQVQILKTNHLNNNKVIDGVFLTHAHIGHYTGLMYFGREAMGGNNIPVYAMPRMKSYLEGNGPWSQLVDLNNVDIKSLQKDSSIVLNTNLKITPFLVPHRDEYSETVGYKIIGKNKTALFIPDINKWDVWNRNIIQEVKRVDYAFLDASFFADGELDRDMSKIPHPFTTETTSLFENESVDVKNKIHFIHFNHSNPAIKNRHPLKDSLQNLGFRFPKEGSVFEL